MSNPIFSDQFERAHGRPMDFFLKGGSKSIIGRDKFFFDTPEEHEEWIRSSFSPSVASKSMGMREDYEKTMAKPVDVSTALRAYRSDPLYVTVGDPLEIARNITALDKELRTNSRPNPMPLYRGAKRAPILDAQNNMPVSFSENRHVAGHFARSGRGEIFKVGHNEVRGIRMEDYGVKPAVVGPSNLSEKEWLIDPSSIKS